MNSTYIDGRVQVRAPRRARRPRRAAAGEHHGGIELHGKGVQYCMYRMGVLVLPIQVGSTVHLYYIDSG